MTVFEGVSQTVTTTIIATLEKIRFFVASNCGSTYAVHTGLSLVISTVYRARGATLKVGG